MSIFLKIQQGTVRSTGRPLCATCQYAVSVTDGAEKIRCTMLSGAGNYWVRGAVYECSHYYSSELPTLNALEETAWTLRTERGGKVIGFAPPERERK